MDGSIDQNTLQRIFSYDSATGFLIWKINRGQRKIAGLAAGYKDTNGYLVVNVDYKRYYLHHLVYIYHHGELPDGKRIRFADGNRHNPRIENLYTIAKKDICGNTTFKNNPIKMYNTGGRGNVKKNSPEYREDSGYPEITWDKQRKVWHLKVLEKGKIEDYGDFPHLDLAVKLLKHCQSSEAFLAAHKAPEPKPRFKNIFEED